MTAKQAEKELNRQVMKFEEQCKRGLFCNEKIKLSEFIPQYLAIMQSGLSPATHAFYKRAIESLITPTMGHMRMKDIKPPHIQNFIQFLSNERTDGTKLNPATVRRYLTILQSIMKQACKLELISDNPARSEKLTVQKIVEPKIEIFTKKEAAEMLACLEQEELQFQVIIQLAIYTGARRGELVGLKFSDVDAVNKKITIERAAIKLKGKPAQTKEPKDYEVRTVSINDYCVELIRTLQTEKKKEALRQGSHWNNGDWLFTQYDGSMMNPQTPTKQFSVFLKKNGLKHRKFHSLRHTSATLLLYGGLNIKQVQSRLGHGDIETTNKYLHYIAEADEAAADILGDMLIAKKQG